MALSSNGSRMENVNVAEGKPQVAKDVYETLKKVCKEAMAREGKVTMAISGGSLPGLLASHLCMQAKEAPERVREALGLPHWHIYLVDERCVPLTHADANYRALRDTLLDPLEALGLAPPAHHLHPIDTTLLHDPTACAKAYADRIARTLSPATPPVFDVIFLGMGPDGHTASLFPNHPLLRDTSGAAVLALQDSPKPPPCRVTLSLPVLLAARQVVVVATGLGKAAALAAVFADEDAPGSTPLPMRRVRQGLLARAPSDRPVLTWCLDNEAASSVMHMASFKALIA